MRLLIIECPSGTGGGIVGIARDAGAEQTAHIAGVDGDTVTVRARNEATESLIAAVSDVRGTSVTVLPHEIMLLTPDDVAGRRQIEEPSPRAPIEIYLRGLKTVGTWSSFLAYAVIAGVLGWVALWQNSAFILVGAVLVAPFPSPALNTALATACGDGRLLLRSIVRYVVSLVLGVAVAYLLSAAVGLSLPTDLMKSVSFVSYTAVLLPLSGGAAAALYLSESEESSLISAAAAGVLVAVALVPPVGVAGMSMALGEWDAARRALFLLLLQIVGINVAAPLVLWAYHVRPGFAWIQRGRRAVAVASFACSVAALGGLLAWQLSDAPSLGRPTVARHIQVLIVDALRDDADVDYVGSDVRFATARPGEPDLLVGTVYIRPRIVGANDVSAHDVQARLQDIVANQGYEVVPLIDVTVLNPPE